VSGAGKQANGAGSRLNSQDDGWRDEPDYLMEIDYSEGST
jgi:hypothetical protein